MELRDYARILVKRGWIIALVAVVAAGSALVFSLVQPTVYRASIIVKVQPARLSDWGQTQAIKDILNTFTRDITTLTMAQQVNDRLQLDLPAPTLLGKIVASPDPLNYEIRIDARDRNKDIALKIAETWAQVFTEARDKANLELDQSDRVLVDIRDYATWDVFSPKKKINTAAGGILGLLLGAIIVFALEYVEAGVFHSAEDVERYAGLPVLGAIPPTLASDSATAPGPIRRWQQRWLGN
jgi:capsular polysaccharide biosynthesis protein